MNEEFIQSRDTILLLGIEYIVFFHYTFSSYFLNPYFLPISVYLFFSFLLPLWLVPLLGVGERRTTSSVCLRKALSHTIYVCALCITLSYYICSCLYSFTFDFFSSLLFSFQEWLGFFDFLSSVSMCCVHYMKMETITPYHFMH